VATSTSDYLKQTSYPGLEAGRAELVPPSERYGTPMVRAEVVNTGEGSAEQAYASVALYDAEGRLVDVALLSPGEGYGYGKTLSPGDMMPFRGYLQRPGLEIGRQDYEVAVYADGKKTQK
jgi:hypothetical protein